MFGVAPGVCPSAMADAGVRGGGGAGVVPFFQRIAGAAPGSEHCPALAAAVEPEAPTDPFNRESSSAFLPAVGSPRDSSSALS